MSKKRNKRIKITLIVLITVLFVSIGYAALTTVLKINSNISLGKASFAIHFDNVEAATHKATVNTEAAITNEEKTIISFDVGIPRIGDYYRFTTDIVNEGSIPGKVKSIEINGLTESQKRLIKYKVTYTGTNKLLSVGDFFGPNSSKNMTVEVIYELSEDVENEDLPTDTLNLECEFIINFENGTIDEFRSRAASSKLTQSTHYMSSEAIHLDQPANSNDYSGLYILDETKDDDFPIYFYRGNSATPNNVLFAGFCWRIIRTTDTGGVKIIYNGTPTEEGYCTTTTGDATIVKKMKFGSVNDYLSSNVRTALYSWYFENLIEYQAYLEDTVYCNRKSYSNGNRNIVCPDASSISMAIGNNSYPIGLISGQEANLGGLTSSSSSYSWLYTNKDYWMMEDYSRDERMSGAIGFNGMIANGSIDICEIYRENGLRPVVSLNSEVILTDGDGTTANPYHVSLS